MLGFVFNGDIDVTGHKSWVGSAVFLRRGIAKGPAIRHVNAKGQDTRIVFGDLCGSVAFVSVGVDDYGFFNFA